jgi:superfamily I DNA/RNA helicase
MLEDAISEGYHIELSFLVNIINNYDLSIEEYIKILENHLSSPKYSELILITAHKSKGLEFLSVELANDFKEYVSEETSIEEKNLIYVAMSRSIEELKLNKDLLNLS